MVNPSHYGAGWHSTATLGTMAGAFASGVLFGLSRGVHAVI